MAQPLPDTLTEDQLRALQASQTTAAPRFRAVAEPDATPASTSTGGLPDTLTEEQLASLRQQERPSRAREAEPETGAWEAAGRAAATTGTFGLANGLMDRERNRRAREEHPWASAAGDVAAVVAQTAALGPLGAAARGVQAANAGRGLLAGAAGVTARAAEALAPTKAATSLAGASMLGAKVGASNAALQGAGEAVTDPTASWGDVGAKAAGSAAVGAVGGALLGPVVHGIVRGYERMAPYWREAAELGRDTDAAATRALKRAMDETGLDPNALTAKLIEDFTIGRKGIRPEEVTAAFMLKGKINPATSRPYTKKEIAGILKNQGNPLSEATLTKYVSDIHDKLGSVITPRNILELAAEVKGPGGGAGLTQKVQAAANFSEGAQEHASTTLLRRQVDQHGRVSRNIQENISPKNFYKTQDELEETLRTEAKPFYQAFYAEKTPNLLSDQITALRQTDPAVAAAYEYGLATAKKFGRTPLTPTEAKAFSPIGENGANTIAALLKSGMTPQDIAAVGKARGALPGGSDAFFIKEVNKIKDRIAEGLPPHPGVLPAGATMGDEYSPFVLDMMQRKLRQFAERPTEGIDQMAAQQTRKHFLDIMEDHFPTWKDLRTRYAEGKEAQDILALGRAFGLRPGAGQDEVLKQFRAMSDPQKEVFRVGLAKHLQDQIDSKRATHTLGIELDTPAARSALQEILGDKNAAAFYKVMDREMATTRTMAAMLRGSRTAPMMNQFQDLMEAAGSLKELASGNPVGVLRKAAQTFAREKTKQKAENLTRAALEDNPQEVLARLQRMGSIRPAERLFQQYAPVPLNTMRTVGAEAPNLLAPSAGQLQAPLHGGRQEAPPANGPTRAGLTPEQGRALDAAIAHMREAIAKGAPIDEVTKSFQSWKQRNGI